MVAAYKFMDSTGYVERASWFGQSASNSFSNLTIIARVFLAVPAS